MIALTVKSQRRGYASSMEWMLQAVDEVDDALSTLRLLTVGWRAEFGSQLAEGAAVVGLCAVLMHGAA